MPVAICAVTSQGRGLWSCTGGWPPINRAGLQWGLLGWLEESLLTVGSEWGEVRQRVCWRVSWLPPGPGRHYDCCWGTGRCSQAMWAME